MIDGGVVSTTVTVKEPVAMLPWPSSAEQLTVVVPSGKLAPEAGLQTTVRGPTQASMALAVKVTVAWPPPVHSVVMGEGKLRLGGVVSCTVTAVVQLAV